MTGPALNHWPIQGAMVTLDPAVAYDYVLPAAHRAFVYVVSGTAVVAGRRVGAGQTAWSDPSYGDASSVLPLAAVDGATPARLMVYSGEPIREPVAMGGPFVMNSRVEIAKAFLDFHAGRFGDVPRQARLAYDR
ncbi:MAG: hypothetical protein M3Q27_17345 [Actinomycetota bacterium]|nr:hypothetical protein [Actinomycetota bacterium]